MDLRHLRAFVGVADSGGFSAAAATLRLTQGAVSKQVAALESETGLVLLRRSNRGAALTDAGRTFLPVARSLIKQHVGAEDEVRRTPRREASKADDSEMDGGGH